MPPTLTQNPFDDLRSLVRALRSEHDPSHRSGSDQASEIYSQIDDWIAVAEQRRDRNESIIASARDAFIAVDSAGQIVEWNQQAERIFGWSAQEAIGRPVTETIIPPAQRAAHEAGLKRFLEIGDGPVLNQRLNVPALRRDGTQFPAELTILEPQRIGDAYVFNAFLRDITRRQQAADAVQGSEALYHSLVDSLPINVTRKDLNGRITFVNRPFCELVGMTPAELLGKTDYDLVPRQLADKFRHDDQYVVSTGDVFHTIEENRADDHVINFEVWKVPVRNAVGDVVETQAVFWDVTEREENRVALARERDLLRTLMDSLPDLIYVKDEDGRFVTVNRALLQIWGNPAPESIEGWTPFDVAPQALAAEYAAEDREVLQSGKPLVDREQRVVGPADELLVFSTTKVPLHDAHGRVTGLVGIDRNITNRKRNEEELQKARRAADAASQAKSDFVANMSHEIRTPMNAIIGMTELTLDTELTPTQRDYLTTVRESGEALLSLINDILDFSKIEAGKLTLEQIPFSLRDYVGNTFKLLAIRAQEADLNLSWRVDNAIPDLLIGDPHRVRQILINLVGNAIKFTERGEVVLDVRQKGDTTAGAQLTLEFVVRDTGVGIPGQKLSRIFGAFEQADASTTRRFTGTGLGLAISSRLVELMNGEIRVESEVGRGSTFTFTALFAVGTKASHESSGGAPQFEDRRSLTTLPPLDILLAEDSLANQKLAVALLQKLGHRITVANNGREALEFIDSGQAFDLVLMDVQMPEMDGFEATSQIRLREQDGQSRIPVVAMTAHAMTGDRERCLAAGMDDYVSKPVRTEKLVECIARCLKPQN